MELFLSRKEIRRRVLARLGNSTNDAQAPLVMEQYNESIRAAAEMVYLRCPWSQSQRESFIDIGIDQRFVNYPEQTGPGNILAIGVWDEGKNSYFQLRRGRIGLKQDDEPLVAAGGDDTANGRDMPELYELKQQIELWPRADIAYQLKIDHTIHPNMEADESVSVVDAECIVLLAMADAFEFQGDGELATIQRGKYEERIRRLISEQHPLETVQRGKNDRLSVGRSVNPGYVPDSGSWPSRMP